MDKPITAVVILILTALVVFVGGFAAGYSYRENHRRGIGGRR